MIPCPRDQETLTSKWGDSVCPLRIDRIFRKVVRRNVATEECWKLLAKHWRIRQSRKINPPKELRYANSVGKQPVYFEFSEHG